MLGIHRARSNSATSQESWALAERIHLLELFIKDLLWDSRAEEMEKEFGSKRAPGFFTARSCKDELHRIFNQANPEHVNTGLPAHPRGKEAAEMWLKYYRKELEKKREDAKQMLRIKMRKNLDLVLRFKEGKLPTEELMALRDRQYEIDAQRPDAERYEKGVQKIINQSHAEDITNVNSLEDLLRIFRGERLLKGSEPLPPSPRVEFPLSPPIIIPRSVDAKEAVTSPTISKGSPAKDVYMASPASSPKQVIASPERVKSPVQEFKKLERPNSISNKPLVVSASPGETGIVLRIRTPPITPQSVSRSSSLVTTGTPPRTSGLASPTHVSVSTPTKEEIDLNSPPSSGLRSHSRPTVSSPPRVTPSSPVAPKIPKVLATQTPAPKPGPLTRARLLSSDTDNSDVADTGGLETVLQHLKLRTAKKKETAGSSPEPLRKASIRSPPKEIVVEPEGKIEQELESGSVSQAQPEAKMEEDDGKRKRRKKSTTIAEHDTIAESTTGVQLRKRKAVKTEPTPTECVPIEAEISEAPPAKNLRSSYGNPPVEIAAAVSPPRPSQPVVEPPSETMETEIPLAVAPGRRASTRIQVQRKASFTVDRTPSEVEIKKEPDEIAKVEEEEPIVEAVIALRGVSASTQTDVSVRHVLQPISPITLAKVKLTRSRGAVQKCLPNVGSQTDQVEFAPDDVVYVKRSTPTQWYEIPIKLVDLESEINKPVKRIPSKIRIRRDDKDTIEAIALEHKIYDIPATATLHGKENIRSRISRSHQVSDIDDHAVAVQQVQITIEESDESAAESKDDETKRKPTRTQPARESARPGAVTKHLLMALLKQIQSLRDAAIFTQPVDEKDVPGYHAVIKEPMDLSKIRRRIESGVIETLSQLKEHLLLMFTNAIMFNTTGHHVNQAAKDLLKQSARIIRDAQHAAGELSDLSPSPKSRRSALTSALPVRGVRSVDTPKASSVTISHSPTPSDISTTDQGGTFLVPSTRATPPASIHKMYRSRAGMPPSLRGNSTEPTEGDTDDVTTKRRLFGRKLQKQSMYRIPVPKSNV